MHSIFRQAIGTAPDIPLPNHGRDWTGTLTMRRSEKSVVTGSSQLPGLEVYFTYQVRHLDHQMCQEWQNLEWVVEEKDNECS